MEGVHANEIHRRAAESRRVPKERKERAARLMSVAQPLRLLCVRLRALRVSAVNKRYFFLSAGLVPFLIAERAAARRATGTRKGEHET